MKRFLLLLAAIVLGLTSGELLSRNFVFRRSLGRFVRHDELHALVGRRGIYTQDLAQRVSPPNENPKQLLQSAIDQAKVAEAAARQPISPAEIDRQMQLLRWQFPSETAWNQTLARAGLTTSDLRAEVAETLRGAAWIEGQIARQNLPNDGEVATYYSAHPAEFQLPQRFRASHLFLAAPDGYPDAVINGKRAQIAALALRLENGDDFATLVAEQSEDEETKTRGGDLNYFAQERMLPEIFAAAQTLPVGLTSAPIRSRLGFHLLRATEKLPAAQLSLAQASPEIAANLKNEKRRAAVAAVVAQLDGKIAIATRGN